jgi:hypothetical protein
VGFFDKYRNKRAGEKSNSDGESFRVPKNCSLDFYNQPPAIPAVNNIKGGGMIASMGVTSDQPIADLETLLKEIEISLSDGQPTINLSTADKLSDVFLENDSFVSIQAMIWELNPKVFVMWNEGATILQRLICLWLDQKEAGMLPILYLREPNSAAATLLVSILSGLGFTTHGVDSDGSTVVVAMRADEIKVTCLLGPVLSQPAERTAWFEDLSARRIVALKAGNDTNCNEIEEELRIHLDSQLSPLRAKESKAPVFARYLRGLMWDAASGNEIANQKLLRCLVDREANLVFPVDKSTGGVVFREWPGIGHGLEVFPDISLAMEMADPDVSQVLGDLPGVDLLQWMAKENAGLAIRLGDPDEPSRVLFFDSKSVDSMLKET